MGARDWLVTDGPGGDGRHYSMPRDDNKNEMSRTQDTARTLGPSLALHTRKYNVDGISHICNCYVVYWCTSVRVELQLTFILLWYTYRPTRLVL